MNKTVLIVDDAQTIRDIVTYSLAKHGFEVKEAEDGIVGLKMVEMHKPDLIVTDFNMPNMNGIEFASQLKKNESTKSIPIFMLTTEASKELAFKGKEAGILAWIVKPFDPDKFSAMIKKYLNC